MSKIFLNKRYRTSRLSVLDDKSDPIDTMCFKSTNYLLKRISQAISVNNLMDYNMLSNSLTLKEGTSSASDKVHWRTVYDELDFKVKIDDSSSNKVGHFRFYLPPILGPQILIVIQSKQDQQKRQLLMLFAGNNMFYSAIQKFFTDSANCIVKPLALTSSDLRSCLDCAVCEDKLDSIGDLELWFGKFNTAGKLGSITINVNAEDVKRIHKKYKGASKSIQEKMKDFEYSDIAQVGDRGVSIPIYHNLVQETSLLFNKLNLVRVKCGLFSLTFDGKVIFTDLMTPLNPDDVDTLEDDRVSIWVVLNRMINSL